MHSPKQLNNFGTHPALGGAPQRTPQGENSEQRGMWEPPALITFPLPWFREDAEGLHRLFMRAEILREQGLSLNKALRHRWHGPRFHSAHRVKVRRNLPGLRARYYRWQRGGRTPECIAVRFISKLPPVPPETVRAFVAACAVAGVSHFSQAFRLTDSKGLSYRRVCSALPDQVLRAIRETFKARRLAEIEARKLVKQFREKEHSLEVEGRKLANQFRDQKHRLIAADVVRSRKLAMLVESSIRGRGVSGVESTSLKAKAPVQAIQGPLQANLKGVANVG